MGNCQVIVNTTDGQMMQGYDLDTSNETYTINRSKSNFESRSINKQFVNKN